ncbi:MAG: hypothetical protein IPO72_10660 [Saprospiraceae bacterium]|nr:hypothetical protein [Candidatus Vicinibacter affinis]
MGKNKFVDAVKAEGTAGNWAHHVTIEKLNIVNYGVDQQAVGISTKCPTWNWIIRSNIIIGARNRNVSRQFIRQHAFCKWNY